MRIVLIWILMISIFNSNLAFGQLLQFEVIWHHYKEHKAENSNLTFRTFLTLHYANRITHPDDLHQDHKRLPFKSQNGQLKIQSVIGDAFVEKLDFPKESHLCSVYTQTMFCYAFQLATTIWQPPKLILLG